MYCLVDCNSFYASCERVFDPRLKNKPIVVLSNNDGCCIAASSEAKACGIHIGQPHFEVKDLIRQHDIQVFSSNYELYGDMSRRVVEVLRQFVDTEAIEVYSIDESFLTFSAERGHDWDQLGQRIATTIERWTGIPVHIGFGATKTLAKAASVLAKKSPTGVCSLADKSQFEIELRLETLSIEKVWGIGRALSKKMHQLGIRTAGALGRMPLRTAQLLGTITLRRTVAELQGTACIELDTSDGKHDSVICTRSFGRSVTELGFLEDAIAHYLFRACEKLRQYERLARTCHFYIRTGKHSPQRAYASRSVHISAASHNPSTWLAAVLPQVHHLYKPGFRYGKAGVGFFNLSSTEAIQLPLHIPAYSAELDRVEQLYHTVDQVNAKWGSNTLKLGRIVSRRPWRGRRELLSQRYTTKLDEVMVAG